MSTCIIASHPILKHFSPVTFFTEVFYDLTVEEIGVYSRLVHQGAASREELVKMLKGKEDDIEAAINSLIQKNWAKEEVVA